MKRNPIPAVLPWMWSPLPWFPRGLPRYSQSPHYCADLYYISPDNMSKNVILCIEWKAAFLSFISEWLDWSILINKKQGGTAAAGPPPFRPGNPALCGSCPLVTPYYCRLGDLLCYNCMRYLSYHFVCIHVYFVFSLFSGLFSFVDFPSVLWYCWLGLLTCKNRLPYNL